MINKKLQIMFDLYYPFIINTGKLYKVILFTIHFIRKKNNNKQHDCMSYYIR